MPEIMTTAEIAELRALEAAATPGPWVVDECDGSVIVADKMQSTDRFRDTFARSDRPEGFESVALATAEWPHRTGELIAEYDAVQAECEANTAIIAAMRNALPRLLATVETLAARAETAERNAMFLSTRPRASDLAAEHYRAKTLERELDDCRRRHAITEKDACDQAEKRDAAERALAAAQAENERLRAQITPAAADVLAERQRQISAEGWTPEHDDEHSRGEMASAAACYAVVHKGIDLRPLWPWSPYWWKPTDRRRNLTKAGALILAEIERLDRADARRDADA
jgi:hypothetical protein